MQSTASATVSTTAEPANTPPEPAKFERARELLAALRERTFGAGPRTSLDSGPYDASYFEALCNPELE